MVNKKKSGKSLILLTIVICVMTFALIFVARFFNNKAIDTTAENVFKQNVTAYCNEINEYNANKQKENSKYREESLNACGVELKSVIPDIVDTDMSKFKIERGELIYIGVDTQEQKWTEEVK